MKLEDDMVGFDCYSHHALLLVLAPPSLSSVIALIKLKVCTVPCVLRLTARVDDEQIQVCRVKYEIPSTAVFFAFSKSYAFLLLHFI